MEQFETNANGRPRRSDFRKLCSQFLLWSAIAMVIAAWLLRILAANRGRENIRLDRFLRDLVEGMSWASLVLLVVSLLGLTLEVLLWYQRWHCHPNRVKGFAAPTHFWRYAWSIALAGWGTFGLPLVCPNDWRITSVENGCINNLRLFDGAKKQWALENNKPLGSTPTWEELRVYMAYGNATSCPTCPGNGIYQINKIGEAPTCSEKGHLLP